MASSLSSASSHHSYVTERSPGKYGGMQEDYVLQSQRAIQNAARQISVGVSEGKDLTALFYELLEDLSSTRRMIAIAHKTIDSEKFGLRRGIFSFTPTELADGQNGAFLEPATLLSSTEYSAYNTAFLKELGRLLNSVRPDKMSFSETTFEEKKTVLGRLNKFTVELFTGKDICRLSGKLTIEELNAAITIEGAKPKTVVDFINTKDAMFSLKNSAPDLYKKLRMGQYLNYMSREYPSPKKTPTSDGTLILEGPPGNLKTHIVLATNRLEIDGKLYAMSQYLTWMYCNSGEDPIDRMLTHSKVMVIHQNTFLIEDTLKDISRVFKKAVIWNRDLESLDVLKNNVALLHYEFSHCMPFERGSAAIAEWLEAAIYHYHGFTEFHHSKTSLSDLEALTSLTLEDFMKRYDRTIALA